MNNLRLRNYRCFSDTGDIDIRPITLLIGANSTGKSSFLKFFPLLKQTIGEFVNGLFMWTGPLVDLENFKNTVKDGTDEMTIGFTIRRLPVRSRTREKLEELNDVRIEILLAGHADDDHYDYIKHLKISFDKHSFSVMLEKGTLVLKVDNLSSTDLKDKIIFGGTNSLLPKVGFLISEDEVSDEPQSAYMRMKGLMNSENKILFLRTIIRTYDNVFEDDILKERLLGKDKSAIQEKDVELFINNLHYFTVNRLIDSINIYLIELANRTTYVKPLRAIVERYYRFSNLSVKEISADGSNLPMFYNSLSKEYKRSLDSWLERLFGFKIKLKSSEGHLELLIQEKGNKSLRNLVDVGFGYTQILPILTILWKKIYMDEDGRSNKYCRTSIVAIEQPELHLHPRFQGMFANMLSVVLQDANEKNIDLRIIIESHSETIVNRLGEMVADENNPLKPEDVSILIFNSSQDNLKREITSSHYDNDGMLSNWPYGFFSDYVY